VSLGEYINTKSLGNLLQGQGRPRGSRKESSGLKKPLLEKEKADLYKVNPRYTWKEKKGKWATRVYG